MAIGPLDTATSTFSTPFLSPGIRPTDSLGRSRPVEPVDSVATGTTGVTGTTGTGETTLNTAPTSAERDSAVASGRTRGSFVDIRA